MMRGATDISTKARDQPTAKATPILPIPIKPSIISVAIFSPVPFLMSSQWVLRMVGI